MNGFMFNRKRKKFWFFWPKKSSTKVLQKFEKLRIFPKKKVFSSFLMFFHFLRSKMRCWSTYADYLRCFEAFLFDLFIMVILLKDLSNVFDQSFYKK